MKALISIALYNQLPFTKDCLRYLFKNTDPKLFELAIIDNASTDGTREWLKNDFANSKEYKNVNTVIYFNDKNAGFSYAHNQAGKENKCDAIILLNNDTIPLKGWLEPLLEGLERPNVGIVGSKLISPKSMAIQHAGVVFLEDGRPYHRYLGYPIDANEVNKPEVVPAITGACFAVKKELWDLLGGLDQRYWCVDKDRPIVIKDEDGNISIYKISDIYDLKGEEIDDGVKKLSDTLYTLVPNEDTTPELLDYKLTKRQKEIYEMRYVLNYSWEKINKELGLNQSAHKILSNGFNKNHNLFAGKWEKIKFIKRSKSSDRRVMISDKFGQTKVTENHLISCINGDIPANKFNDPNKQRVIVTVPRSKLNFTISNDEAILVGAYCSEGSISNKQVCIASCNIKWLEKVSKSIHNLFPEVDIKFTNYDSRVTGIRINNNENIRRFLSECGIGCENKKIPNKFFNAKKSVIKQLIDTLVEGDGHIVKRKIKDTIMYTSKSIQLTAGISLLLKILGIQHSIYYNEKKHAYNIKTIESFSSKKNCGLKKEIFEPSDEYVYDLGVENTHYFADALGLKVIHNCGWEDIAFCLKARERGYDVWYEPRSRLFHYEGSTEGRYLREDANMSLFFNEWGDKIALWGNKNYADYKKELKLKDRSPQKLQIKNVKVGQYVY